MRAAIRCITPVMLLVLLPTRVDCFTGLTTTSLRRADVVGAAAVHRHAPSFATAGRPRGTRSVMAMEAKLANKATITVGEANREDPYVVEAALVEEDKAVYLALLALQLLPSFFVNFKYASFFYFGLLAVSTVYLGAKRQDIPDERTAITTKQAFGAPVASSVSLFGIFWILKYTNVSVGFAYQVVTTLLAVGSAVSILPPILRTILPTEVANLPVSAPIDGVLAKAFPKTWEDDDQPLLDLAELTVLASAVSAAFVYFNPDVALSAKFLIPNVFAWCIGMQSIGLLSISSFTTAAVLLGGLFCYDIFWVFGTEVMMTVATKIEAPVKFLFPSVADPSKQYPFSVLGLGDIVIPATFCTLMRSFDKHLEGAREAEAAAARALAEQVSSKNPVALWLDSIIGTPVAKAEGASGRVSMVASAATVAEGGTGAATKLYFESSVTAYALGLGLCFAVNFISRSGQPALLYLNPMLIASALATAAFNGDGEIQKLLAFGGDSDEAEATPKSEA